MTQELFSPERLRLARQRRGLLAQELAARLGVTPKTISRWENGERSPESEFIDPMSRVLEFPRDFFFGDAPPILDSAKFRALARMTARQRNMALAAGSQALALDAWIEQHFERPRPNVPELRDVSPVRAAEALRAAWGLGYRPIQNLIHLLEKNGIRVYSLVHDGTEVDAFSDWQGNTPFVFLNMSKTAERSRMDAAHELGHLVLHGHTGGDGSKAQEDEAQAFASAFLMPQASFIATSPARISLATVIEAKQVWGVSALAYVHRLHNVRRLRDWHYRSLCIEIKTQFRREEPGPPRQRETSQVLSKVLIPPRLGGSVTRKDAAKRLRVHVRDLDDITFGLALTSVVGGIVPPRNRPSSQVRSPGMRLIK